MAFKSFKPGGVLISLSIALGGCQVTEDQLETYVRSKGFSILVPPSNLYAPGALVYRSNYDPEQKPIKPTMVKGTRRIYTVLLSLMISIL